MLQKLKQYRYWQIFQPDICRMEEALRAEVLPISIAEEVWEQLDLLLLDRLNHIAYQPLYHLQKLIATEKNALATYGLELISNEQQAASLDELIQQAEKPDFFPTQLPRCRGYLDKAMEHFLLYVRTLLVRVADRKQEIETQLLTGRFTQIIGIISDAGDLHNYGQATALISTDVGTFVYKPHDPGIDGFMLELAQNWFEDTMRVPKVVTGGTYGFHEFIVNRPAATTKEAREFYFHLGGQCAVFKMLGSYDLHIENFLTVGGMPVPIDMETMIRPTTKFDDQSKDDKQAAFYEDLSYSLYGSAIFPVNIDGFEFSILMNDTEKNKAAPCIDGKRTTVLEYTDSFFEGFRLIYHRCVMHRDEIAAFLHNYPAVPIRKLMHNTNDYAKLLMKLYSYREKSQHDDLALLMKITNDPMATGGIPEYDSIATCEAESMCRGDIPYFYTMSDSIDLMCENRTVYTGFMKMSAINHALDSLARMSDTEMNFELRLFQEVLSKQLRKVEQPKTGPRTLIQNNSCSELLAEAEKIFLKLDEDAIRSPSGGINWMELSSHPGCVAPLQLGLATGLSGILLFMAVLCKKTKNGEIQTKAQTYCDELLSLHELALNSNIWHKDTVRIDYPEGVAGVLFALCCANEYLHDTRCNTLIQRLVCLIGEIPENRHFESDFMSGIAGLVHVLYRLPELRNEALIRRFADRLLEKKTLSTKLGYNIWHTAGKARGISGAGHGQAGIGVALWNAWQVLGDEKYRQASLDCFHWEHQIFNKELSTWPDLREITVKPVSMHGFCSGAPGMGLALLSCDGLRDVLDTYDQDLQRALEAVNNTPPLYRDHLCCGNMSAIEFLLTYGRHMHSNDAISRAKDRLSECLTHQEIDGEFHFTAQGFQSSFIPDLFYGISGIGYTLLRMLDDKIPSVLLG